MVCHFPPPHGSRESTVGEHRRAPEEEGKRRLSPPPTQAVESSCGSFVFNFSVAHGGARPRPVQARARKPAAAATTSTMGKSKPGLTQPIGDESMSLAYQLELVHANRRLAQHEIKTDQACQFAEMKRRQDAIAKSRPRPPATGRFAKWVPSTEAEAILHAQPQTTMQHIGHHTIPKIPPPKPLPPKFQSEYQKFQKGFPNSTSREVGHHPDFLASRRGSVSQKFSR